MLLCSREETLPSRGFTNKTQKTLNRSKTNPLLAPKRYTENRTPALEAFALFLVAGPAPRAELIRATGRVTLSLAMSSWRQISYFGPGRRERSRDHPDSALRSSPGSIGGSRDECPAMLPAHRQPSKGENVISRSGDLWQTGAEAFVPTLLTALRPQRPSLGIT